MESPSVIHELAKSFARENHTWHWSEQDIEAFGRMVVYKCAQVVQDCVDQRIPASEYPSILRDTIK